MVDILDWLRSGARAAVGSCGSGRRAAASAALLVLPLGAHGATSAGAAYAASVWGILALIGFAVAYGFVVAEEVTGVRKSKPMVVAAGLVWVLVAIALWDRGPQHAVGLLRANLTEYAELLLFLIAAMTYVNTLDERQVFASLRDWLVARGLTYRGIFWVTGLMAFVLSPLMDNLTTALVMGAVVLAIARGSRAFIAPACINIVVAANAGGAFSPFGDITTLMVWQNGKLEFFEFFALLVPSLVSWLIPAACMSFALPSGAPESRSAGARTKQSSVTIVMLFALTIVFTVAGHIFLHLPPFIGMMTGLGLLQLLGHRIRQRELRDPSFAQQALQAPVGTKPARRPFDIFISMKRVEWDTLMFFYGVVLCVGGLGALGYLAIASQATYAQYGATAANVLVGIASAVVDNIPIMFAVLSVSPEMSHGQWLLVTLTAGIGGSMLAVGSAAGVALMGLARGSYTFSAHLKWSWAIAVGYVGAVLAHFLVNAWAF
jgi:Na+/H+ antiporter NhaD/arsenite permease-like protein